MSLDYVEIELDRPRRLRFGFRDLRDLEGRLGGVPFEQVLSNLRALHLNTLVQALQVGLRADDGRSLTAGKVEDLVQGYLDKGKPISGILDAIAEALMLSGIVGRTGAGGKGEGDIDRPT